MFSYFSREIELEETFSQFNFTKKKIKVVVALFFTFPHLWPTQGGYLLTLYQVCLIEAVEVWPCFHVVGLVSVINNIQIMV